MFQPIKNFAKVQVSTTYDDAATSIVLESGDGAKLPDPATQGEFSLVWWNSTDYSDPSDDPNVEIVRVTAVSTDTLTVIRGYENTAASTKNTASKTYLMILTLTEREAAKWSSVEGNSKLPAVPLGSTDHSTVIYSHGAPVFSTSKNGNVSLTSDFSDVRNADASGFFDVSAQTSIASTIAFSSDGLIVYVATTDGAGMIYQYDIDPDYPFSTAATLLTYDQSVDTSYGYITSIRLSEDGTKGILTDGLASDFVDFELTTPWDITTLTEGNVMDQPFTGSGRIGVSQDGRHVYVTTNASPQPIRHYELMTPWDLSSRVERGTFNVGSLNVGSVWVNAAGTRLYVGNSTSSTSVRVYGLSTQWDVTTAELLYTQDIGEDNVGIVVSPGEDRIWVFALNGGSTIRQYDMNGPRLDVTPDYIRMTNGPSGDGLKVADNGSVQVGGWVLPGTDASFVVNRGTSSARTAMTDTSFQTIRQGAGRDILIDVANDAPEITFRHSTGTMFTPAATAANNFIGGFRSYGYDGNSFELGAQLFVANGGSVWSDTNHNTEFWFYTTPPDSTSMSARMVLNGYGCLGIGDVSPTARLEIASSENPLDDLNDGFDYHFLIRHDSATTGNAAGMGFSVTNTDGNIGASILHRRTGGNSYGTLEFYTKGTTGGGDNPTLAMTITPEQDVTFENDISAAGTISGLVKTSEETGTTYTLDADDSSGYVRFDNTDPIAVTVPVNASTAFAVGTKFLIEQANTGAVTLTEDSGVTINTAQTLVSNGQYSVVGLVKIDTDEWVAFGDLVAS